MVSYVTYVGQFFCPMGLAVFYPHPGAHLPLWKIVGAAVLLASVSAAALAWRRRYPYLLVGWLWYVGMLVPVVGLVQAGSQAMADRYTYLPQIGLCIALAWGVADVCRSAPYRRWLGPAGSALVIAALMGGAWRQTTFWRDSETLWTRVLSCTSGNCAGHNNLANVLAGRGEVDEAIEQYRKALEIKSDFAEAHNNLASALASRGELDLAIIHYQKALELKPDYTTAHNNLATVRAERETLLKMLAEQRGAARLQPNNVALLNNTAWMLATNPNASVRNGTEAVELIERALKLAGGNEAALLDTLAAAYAEAGRFSEAVAAAGKALQFAGQQNKRVLANALRARIALYEAGKAFRQTSSLSAPLSRNRDSMTVRCIAAVRDAFVQLPSGVFMRNSRWANKSAARAADTRPTPSNVSTQFRDWGAVARSICQSLPPAGSSQRSTSTRK